MDTKGRMVVPAALKRQLPDVEREGLVVNRGFEKKLSYLYTWGVEQDLEAVVSFKSVSGKKQGVCASFYEWCNRVDIGFGGSCFVT